MRLGILGGTFDPPHLGHLIVAQDAFERIPLDRLLFVPAAQPPHKLNAVATSAALRMAMVRAAVVGDDRFEVDGLELERAGPSFTVDSLRELHKRQPGAELFLLLGADQFRELATWREPEAIAELATLVILPRADIDTDRVLAEAQDAMSDARVIRLDAIRIDVSSTEVRRRIGTGESIRYLVPDGVRRIIDRERLYAVST